MRAFFSLLFLILIGGSVYGTYHDHRIDTRLDSIFPKEPESSVRYALGSPSALTSPCEAYGTTVTIGDCDHVMVYKSFFNALHPRYWLIFIDHAGLTTATARQNLP